MALAVVVIGFIVIFFLFSCISARRRRRRGMQPYRGTGWLGTPAGHGQAQYNPQYGAQQQPNWPQQEQTYGQGQSGGYYNYNQQTNAPPAYDPANRGYFGSEPATTTHNTGSTGVYEMQPPNHAPNYGQGAPEVTGAKK